MPQKRMECFRLLLDHLAWIEHRFLSSIRDSRKAGSLWGMIRVLGRVRKSVDQSLLAKGLEWLCWGFKGVLESFRRKRPALFKSGQWHFHQDNSILVTENLTQMGMKTLHSVTFSYSSSSEAVVMRQLRRWNRLWRWSLTHSHKKTSMWSSRNSWNDTTIALQPEEITSKGARVSCVYCQ